jgi:hypothetical protein
MSKARELSKLPNYVLSTVAELKLAVGKEQGDKAFIGGYYTDGDGGGGDFYWDAVSIETDNGGTIFQVTGTTAGRWKRIYSCAVNVKWFGAKEDTTDFNPFLLLAVAASSNVNIDGNFNSRSQVDLSSIRSEINIFSDCNGSITLNPDIFSDDWLRINQVNVVSSFTFKNIKVIGNGTTKSSPVCQIFNVQNAEISGCIFDRSFPAIKNTHTIKYKNNTSYNWRYNGSGLIASGSFISITGNILKITENMASDDTIVVNSSVSTIGNGKVIISDNIIDKIGATSTYCRGGISINGVGICNVIISNNIITNLNVNLPDTIGAIDIYGDVTNKNYTIENNTITDCLYGVRTQGVIDSLSTINNKFYNVNNPIYSVDSTGKLGWDTCDNYIVSSTLKSTIGIKVGGQYSGKVSGNYIKNYTEAISLDSCRCSIIENEIDSCTTAISLINHRVPEISLNKFYYCTNGIAFGTQGFNVTLGIMNNIFVSVATPIGTDAVTYKNIIGNNGLPDTLYYTNLGNKTGSVNPIRGRQQMTVTGNITLYAPTGSKYGDDMTIVFLQNATGYPVTIPSTIYYASGKTVDSTANSMTIIRAVCVDETNNKWAIL